MARLKIHSQIVVPFVVVSTAAVLSAAVVSWVLISRAIDAQLQRQVERTGALLMRSNIATNQTFLEQLKSVVGTEFIAFGPSAEILASTLGPSADQNLIEDVRVRSGEPRPASRDIVVDGRHYRLAYYPAGTPPGAVIALIANSQDTWDALGAVARTIVVATLAMLVVIAVASSLIARKVTGRILELAEFTRRFGRGDPGSLPPAGRDEIGQLASAFGDMAREVAESKERLLRSEKLAVTGMLAARVAHDVRNPLSSIKMQTQLLAQWASTSPSARESVQAILRDVEQVEYVVKGLLELARPGELRLRPGAVNDVLRDVLRQLGPQLRHQKIGIDTHLADDLPDLPIDADRLKQAVLNLVINAADAMPSGGTLAVATRAAAGGTAIEIDVCDEGHGVAPDVLPRLFDPFMTTKRDGVGLGLVNTRGIVSRHGGTVELLPRDGKGTVARVTLPLAPAAAADAHGEAVPHG